MWKGLSVITDSPSPIVVVLSGSMEPAFQRGDLLFLWNRNVVAETSVGEVVVYNVRGKDIPIVHRIVRKFGKGFVSHLLLLHPMRCSGHKADYRTTRLERPEAKLLTKGDNNVSDDTELYASGQDYLVRKDIIGYDDSAFVCSETLPSLLTLRPKKTGAFLPTFLLLAT